MHHIDSLESRRLFAGGAADPTFGASGATTIRIPLPAKVPQFNVESALPLDLLPDAAGRTIVATSGVVGLTLTRLTADGQIDTSFARGALTVPYASPFGGVFGTYGVDGLDATLDSAGRLYTLTEGQLRRFTASGRPDTTFGDAGLFGLTAAGFTARRFATVDNIAADGEGRLVGLATAYNRSGRTHVNELKVAFRLAADGTLDKNFGDNGTIVLNIDRDDNGDLDADQAVLRVLANNAVVAAFNGNEETVASFKLTTTGKADTSYGTKGRYVFSDDTSDVALSLYGIRSDGQVEAVASTAQRGQQAAGNSPAAFDFTYDLRIAADGKSSRKLTARENLREPLAVEADGSKWYFNRAAYAGVGLDNDPVVYRTKADGANDKNFNRGNALIGAAAAVAPDGRILVAVRAGKDFAAPTGRVTVARFFADEGPFAFAAPTVRRTAGGTQSVSFSVLWQDDDAVDRATLDNNDVVVTKGSTTLAARVLSQKVLADGRVLVNYAVTGPGGTWNNADNGTYAIKTKTNAVKDAGGAGNTGRGISALSVTAS